MADAWLSILGLYQEDNTIFADFNVPTGLDRSMAISKIILDNAELGLVYTKPETVKEMIRVWSAINAQAWAKIWSALNAEYNPIHNFDRHEEWTDGEETSYSDSNTNSDKRQVAAWNQATGTNNFADADKVDGNGTTTGEGARDASHEGHLYGNVGVTTTQEMIRAEASLRQELNMYQIISDSFRGEFCLMVY